MPPTKKTTKQAAPELQTGTLHLEWFPAYGIRIKEMPHIVVIGQDEGRALQNLAQFGYTQRRDHGTDYSMVFQNEPFEVD